MLFESSQGVSPADASSASIETHACDGNVTLSQDRGQSLTKLSQDRGQFESSQGVSPADACSASIETHACDGKGRGVVFSGFSGVVPMQMFTAPAREPIRDKGKEAESRCASTTADENYDS